MLPHGKGFAPAQEVYAAFPEEGATASAPAAPSPCQLRLQKIAVFQPLPVLVDPEQALRRTNAKFRRRFGFVEQKLAERGASLADSNIEEMETLWQQAKSRETKP